MFINFRPLTLKGLYYISQTSNGVHYCRSMLLRNSKLAIKDNFWVKMSTPRAKRITPKIILRYFNKIAYLLMNFAACPVKAPTIRNGIPNPNA